MKAFLKETKENTLFTSFILINDYDEFKIRLEELKECFRDKTFTGKGFISLGKDITDLVTLYEGDSELYDLLDDEDFILSNNELFNKIDFNNLTEVILDDFSVTLYASPNTWNIIVNEEGLFSNQDEIYGEIYRL